MKTKYKYIHFELHKQKPKTQVWHCINNSDKIILGVVEWKSGWRRYCYFTEQDFVYSDGCLDDISGFIKQLMIEHKK